MAHITQENKAIIAAALKVALKDYPSVKYSLSIQDKMKIVCTISKGPAYLDEKNVGSQQVNHYHIKTNFNPEAEEILTKIKECLRIGHYDNSDIQSDYFDCAWYIGINIGTWNKPYIVV